MHRNITKESSQLSIKTIILSRYYIFREIEAVCFNPLLIPWYQIAQCRRFLRVRECFARESAMLKLEKRGGNGATQKEQGRGRGEEEEKRSFFSPLPSPLSFFRPSTYSKGYCFYSP